MKPKRERLEQERAGLAESRFTSNYQRYPHVEGEARDDVLQDSSAQKCQRESDRFGPDWTEVRIRSDFGFQPGSGEIELHSHSNP